MMNRMKNIFILIVCIFLLFIVNTANFAQELTRIKGKVTDINTKEPIPFVNIVFAGKNIVTTTDYKGEYSFETQWASNKIRALYIGYISQEKIIKLEKNQIINFQLTPESYNLDEVVIKSNRKRYKNKDNPAVELIKKVIKSKNLNKKENIDFYEYDKYEKIQFDLNNITEKFRSKKALNGFEFIFEYVDTSKINGKPFLPVFLQETVSKVYYRKSPKTQKEYLSGTKVVGSQKYINIRETAVITNYLYQDIDLYDNNINIMTNQFVSPISDIAPTIYKFRILDTVDLTGYSCIKLAFQPRNKLDFAFIGNLFITNDSNYSLKKADLRITEDINLNFINDLQIIQEYKNINNQYWMLTKDDLIIDFSINKRGVGMFGKRMVHYDNYMFNIEMQDTIYSGNEKIVIEEGHEGRDNEFWETNRLVELSQQEEDIYNMVESVQELPKFNRTMEVLKFLEGGYWNFGNVDIGPISYFYNFNEVEGHRLRFGGITSDTLSKKFRIDGYFKYGFNDKRFKYSGSAQFSLNNKPLKDKHKHTIMAMYQDEAKFPGMEMQFIGEDNFLLSIKRGITDKILYYNMFKLEHYKDWVNGFSTTLFVKHIIQEPGGTLRFDYDNFSVNKITSSEISANIRFAPNEKYYQGVNYRTPIITTYPIFQLSYTQGIKDIFNADYTYGKLSFNFFKRFHISPLGFSNFEIEAGKVFGKNIPFPLLFIHSANQTYSYQLYSYNMMNFLEFISDEFVSVNLEHHFYGFFFNKIPLFKRLKLREIISVKGIYGAVSDKNNPNISLGLMNFPTDLTGSPSSFTLDDKPYIEISAGIGNIFKFLRIDVVKRVTYLDNPVVSEYGIRARIKFDF